METRGWSGLLPRVERILDRVEAWTGASTDVRRPAGGDAWAFRWRHGALEPINHPDLFPLEGLIGVERSVQRLRVNVGAFTRGDPCLDTLLYGDRGTGKSSAVRGLLRDLGPKGLRLVEIRPPDLEALPDVLHAVRERPHRFVLVCDDLAFEEGDPAYRELKSALDGGIESRPENALILATSNRRHLVPERAWENVVAGDPLAGELHPEEIREDKTALADRFGLLIPFFGFDQETYLEIVDHHAELLGVLRHVTRDALRERALRYAVERGGRSGRTARQACVVALQECTEGAK